MSRRFELNIQAAWPWATMLRYLQPRLIPGVEHIDGGVYQRRHGRHRLRVALREDGKALQIDGAMPQAQAEIAARISQLFALDENPQPAAQQLSCDPLLGPRIAAVPGLRPLGCWDPFELCLRTVVGQQVSVAAAGTLMGRLVERCGELQPLHLLGADLERLGMPGRRVASLRALAAAVADGALDLQADWPAIDAGLQRLPGFGPWTRSYLAIRLGRQPDAFPASDVGLLRASGAASPAALVDLAERWRPHRALAACYLWAVN